MTFAAPLGLLALAALPAVVVLHLYRNRLPERAVAGLFLFPATAIDSDGGRQRAPLLRSPSFWLECAMALLLAAWLSGPSFAALRPRHLVVVLDDSASMGAAHTLPRARDVLRELGEQYRGGLAAVDQVTVICTGQLPKVVVGPRGDAAALAAFRATWSPRQSGHAPTAALDLGRQLAGEHGELWFVTDGEPGAPLVDVHVRACGAPADNVALTGVGRESRPVGEVLRVRAVGHGVGEGPLERTIVGFDGERELVRAAIAVPRDGAVVEVTLPLATAAALLRVELLDAGAHDALALDDVAHLVTAPAVAVAVCDQLSAAKRRALQLDRVFAALSGWRVEPEPERAWLLVRDRPGALRAGQVEVVLAPTAGAPGGYTSPFVVDRSHPLLAGAALEGVAWGAGGGDLAGQVLVASGDKVLLAEQWPEAGRRLWFDLDGAVGNVTRSPDWPVLWSNLLELAARDAPGLRRRQLRVGDEIAYRGDGSRRVALRGPDGGERASGTDALAAIADQPGIYRLHLDGGAAADDDLVGVNFVDAAESDLRLRSAFDRPPAAPLVAAAAATVTDARPLRRWVALLLLAVVLADWWWLMRPAQGRPA